MEVNICFIAQLNMIDCIWHSSRLLRREDTIGFYGAKLFWKTTSFFIDERGFLSLPPLPARGDFASATLNHQNWTRAQAS
jgi:hypothetical protein